MGRVRGRRSGGEVTRLCRRVGECAQQLRVIEQRLCPLDRPVRPVEVGDRGHSEDCAEDRVGAGVPSDFSCGLLLTHENRSILSMDTLGLPPTDALISDVAVCTTPMPAIAGDRDDGASYAAPGRFPGRGTMTVGTLERTTPPLVERRCRCLRCGAHLMGVVGAATLGARCSTCGSYEVVPLARPALSQSDDGRQLGAVVGLTAVR